MWCLLVSEYCLLDSVSYPFLTAYLICDNFITYCYFPRWLRAWIWHKIPAGEICITAELYNIDERANTVHRKCSEIWNFAEKKLRKIYFFVLWLFLLISKIKKHSPILCTTYNILFLHYSKFKDSKHCCDNTNPFISIFCTLKLAANWFSIGGCDFLTQRWG